MPGDAERPNVKQCRRCTVETLEIIRESIVRRGPRTYLVSWHRCPGCQDVSFSYRLFPDSADSIAIAEDSEQARESWPPGEGLESSTSLTS
jgi:hypothetical protein